MGVGRKKQQRREKKAAKREAAAAAESSEGEGWRVGEKINYLGRDEWFAKMKEEVFDGEMGFAMDGLLRNTFRMTVEIWATGFGALPHLLAKNLLFVQLLVVDEDRTIQGKLYGIGSDVKPDHVNVIKRSRRIFREAAPYLLKDTDRWVFSRSLALTGYDGNSDEAVKFPSYDPLDSLNEMPQDIPNSTRCAEVFFFVGGDFEMKDNGFRSREAVKELLKELDADDLSIQGFFVVAASAQVSKEKMEELNGVHLTA